jgi:thiol-disulfide isomerase/thioredoxin
VAVGDGSRPRHGRVTALAHDPPRDIHSTNRKGSFTMHRPTRRAWHLPAALTMLSTIALVLAACTGPAATPVPATESMAPESMAPHESMAPESMAPESMAPHESMAPESMAPESMAPHESMAPEGMAGDGMAARDALAGHPWATATLTDVSNGQSFTIADFAGRTVFVEAMAIWCTNCRAQQGRFTEALARLDPARVAYVALTVDPSEGADDLARYKANRGFTGTYAVAGRDVSAALKSEFGAIVLSPPNVPLITISPNGEISFGTGGESVDAIIAAAA